MSRKWRNRYHSRENRSMNNISGEPHKDYPVDDRGIIWGDLDFYDGVEEKEEKERMEDKGEMEHEPR